MPSVILSKLDHSRAKYKTGSKMDKFADIRKTIHVDGSEAEGSGMQSNGAGKTANIVQCQDER